jgi:hypothetical protein
MNFVLRTQQNVVWQWKTLDDRYVDTAVSNRVKNADGTAGSPWKSDNTETYWQKVTNVPSGVLRRADAPVCPDNVQEES